MATQFVQSKSGSGTSSAVATFDSAPTEGNLIVVVAFGNNTNDITISGSGWSTDSPNIVWGVSSNLRAKSFYKIAGAGESAEITVSQTSATAMSVGIHEASGITATSPLDKQQSNGDSGGPVSSYSTGTTDTTSMGDEFCIAAIPKNGAVTSPSWSNSFTQRENATYLLTATWIQTTVGTRETTASWTTARRACGMIMTFKGIEEATSSTSWKTLLGVGTGIFLLFINFFKNLLVQG